MIPSIESIKAMEILDSRGCPTVGCRIKAGSHEVFASVPSGSSCGQFEAFELRDLKSDRFFGKGVMTAVENIHQKIAPKLVGRKVEAEKIDWLLRSLDSSLRYENIGANAILAVSMAVYKLEALVRSESLYSFFSHDVRLCLPTPMFNVINGGCHADNHIDVQEFMVVPVGFDSFRDALRCGSEIFHCLKQCLKDRGLSTLVGDEGGFAPDIDTVELVLEIISEAVSRSGYRLGRQVAFAIDFASSEFYHEGMYHLNAFDHPLTSEQWIEKIEAWTERYPIISIEDPMADTDIKGWKELNQKLGSRLMVVGDDLLVTQVDRLKDAIEQGWANAILIKPNQVGSVSQTLETIRLAKDHKMQCIISHRSGETEDTFISDLAVGCQAGFIKAGSLSRSERLAKYNRLIQIENDFNTDK